MPRNWLSFLTLIGLTLVFLVLWESPPKNFLRPQPENIKDQKAHISGFLTEVQIVQFDKKGSINYQFNADKMHHFQIHPKNPGPQDYTDIIAPYIVLHRGSETAAPPWYVQADKGQSTENSEIISLEDNVRAWQKGETTAPELTTSKLVLKPETQYAETDKPVMINAPDSKTQAIGMRADLNRDRIELLSNVRGVHEPNN